MLTHRAVPDKRLRPFIRSYVEREACLAAHAELSEPVLARLGAILEFQFAEPYDVPLYGVDRKNPSEPIAVIGPITWRSARIVIRGHVQALAVMFQPLGFHALFGVPLSPLADVGVEGHALLGSSISALYERLGNASDFHQRVGLLDSFFVDRLWNLRHAPASAAALKHLISSASPLPITEVVRRAGVSERQLERVALQQAGMSPSAMRRIARFQHALRLKLSSGRPWIEIAHAADYYDQMHMVRDFRTLAGASPASAWSQLGEDHISRLVL